MLFTGMLLAASAFRKIAEASRVPGSGVNSLSKYPGNSANCHEFWVKEESKGGNSVSPATG
jgi:hypothetical protein